MRKVASIDLRKSDHIKINLEKDVQSGLTSGLERFHFTHQALPELDLGSIDTRTTLFGKILNAPILISSMTGGTKEAEILNQHLAAAAQEVGVAMGVGSQRAAIENMDFEKSFRIARKTAPGILLFANLGAIQLNYGYSIDHCQRAVDMIEADGLILHLNPLQEALQNGGNTNFKGLAKKIEVISNKIQVPVIIKEVGWGISEKTAKLLLNCGIAAIDVAGAGGTSWSQVEMRAAPNEFTRQLAETYLKWGIPTAESILNVRKVAPEMRIIASGGLKNGLDITKCLALGASLGGMAGLFLKAAAISSQKVEQILKLLISQIEVTMFVAGVEKIENLKVYELERI
jgi:isopentenyl-diphosphate delta-isomerase